MTTGYQHDYFHSNPKKMRYNKVAVVSYLNDLFDFLSFHITIKFCSQ